MLLLSYRFQLDGAATVQWDTIFTSVTSHHSNDRRGVGFCPESNKTISRVFGVPSSPGRLIIDGLAVKLLLVPLHTVQLSPDNHHCRHSSKCSWHSKFACPVLASFFLRSCLALVNLTICIDCCVFLVISDIVNRGLTLSINCCVLR